MYWVGLCLLVYFYLYFVSYCLYLCSLPVYILVNKAVYRYWFLLPTIYFIGPCKAIGRVCMSIYLSVCLRTITFDVWHADSRWHHLAFKGQVTSHWLRSVNFHHTWAPWGFENLISVTRSWLWLFSLRDALQPTLCHVIVSRYLQWWQRRHRLLTSYSYWLYRGLWAQCRIAATCLYIFIFIRFVFFALSRALSLANRADVSIPLMELAAPSYLSQLVRGADLPGRRSLRSARTNRLLVPSVKLSIPSAAGPSRSPDPPSCRTTWYQPRLC